MKNVKTEKKNGVKKESIEAVLAMKSELRTEYAVYYKKIPTGNQIRLHSSKKLCLALLSLGHENESESEDEKISTYE